VLLHPINTQNQRKSQRLTEPPIENQWVGEVDAYGQNADFIRKESYQFSIDSTELRHLENIVATCKNRGVNLLFVQSPRETNNIAFNNWITAFSKSKGVPLYNEDANGFWESHHEFFYDGAHLNSEGADEFSRKIASFVHNKNIKSYFNESSANNL
jgi:lysophospholipase L1-like esterase